MFNSPSFESTLHYLDELRQNNQKTWFEAHRADYETARTQFEQFLEGGSSTSSGLRTISRD